MLRLCRAWNTGKTNACSAKVTVAPIVSLSSLQPYSRFALG